MCRVFGAVAAAPITVRRQLLEAENPLIRQSEEHDSGWGMAVYPDLHSSDAHIERFPVAAHADSRFSAATTAEGRIFNVHVRRATLGGITPENTHPFDFGPYTFSHNGTILDFKSLLRPGMPKPQGDTDSEHFFLRLLNEYDAANPVRSIRGVVATIVASSVFSGLNFIFSDGVKLYAYKLGVFTMCWTSRAGMAMVASEPLSADDWHTVDQDVLLTLDPEAPEEPVAERLIGNTLLSQARIEPLEPKEPLSGAARGEWAAQRAATIAQSNGNLAPARDPLVVA